MLILFLSATAHANICLDSKEQDDTAITLFKIEYICQQSMKLCQDLFQNKIKPTPSPLLLPPCKKENTLSAHITPLPIVFGVKKLSDYYLLNQSLINNVIDFYYHTKLHIDRVSVLAQALLKEFPEEFSELSLEKVKQAMALHDIEKIDSKFISKRGGPFIVELFQNFGGGKDLSQIEELNKTGKDYLQSELKKLNFTPKMLKQLELLERIADIADRTSNPVSPQEFGRAMIYESVKPDHNWIHHNNINIEKYKKMNSFLERKYFDIIPDSLFYHTPTASQQAAIYDNIFINPIIQQLDESDSKVSRVLLHYLNRFHSPLILKKNKIKNFRRAPVHSSVRGALSMISNPLLDGIMLASYSPSLGCGELGYHPWIQEDGKCKAIPGLSREFIENVVMDKKEHPMHFSNTCQVFKENLKVNQAPIFNKHECYKDHIKLLASDKNKMELKLDEFQNIREFRIDKYDPKFWGSFLDKSKVNLVRYDAQGSVSEVCTSKRMSQNFKVSIPGKCYTDLEEFRDDYPQFLYELSALNFKFNQILNCCQGKKNILNEQVSCQK